jgi:hypothetical protein
MLVDNFPETTKERCLMFKYAGEDKVQKSKQLAELLQQNNIDFVCYLETGNYYPCQFTVRRSSKKWNDIMKLVNSVQAPKYNYINTDFYIIDMSKEHKNVLGNMQEVTYCN